MQNGYPFSSFLGSALDRVIAATAELVEVALLGTTFPLAGADNVQSSLKEEE